MSRFDEKVLRRNLESLQLNFSAVNPQTRETYKVFAPPDLEEVRDRYARDETHPKLAEMLEGEAARRLYGAILLAEIDAEKSLEVLEKLSQEESLIKIQKLVGHGSTEIAVKFPARAFLQTGDIRRNFVEKLEKLNEWRTAITQEAAAKNLSADLENLPTAGQIFALAENPETATGIKNALLKLAEDSLLSKRFYAAVGLANIDEAARRKILESLLDEQTLLFTLKGDTGAKIPANQIAREMLAPPVEPPAQFKSQNVFGKIVGWFSKNADEDKK